MMRPSVAPLIVAVMVVCAALAVCGQPAAAQRGDQKQGGSVRPPKQLLEAYPFEQGRLRSRDRSQSGSERAGQGVSSAAMPASEDTGGVSWVLPALVLSSATALLALLVMGRRFGRRTVAAREQTAEPEPASPPRNPRTGRFERRQAAPLASSKRPGNTYAVANQKGGVGKTTISLVLGVAAARRGSRALLVDLDPQASATVVLGADQRRPTVADVMRDPAACSLAEAIAPTEWGLDIAPAEWALRQVDTGLPIGDEPVLIRQLAAVADYDLVLIDCPPNLGALTIDALTAASRALVVTEPTFLALHALDELLNTLDYVTAEHNPSLELGGVVLNRVEATAEHKRSVEEIEQKFGSRVWEPHIPKRAVLQDAMRLGVPPQDLRSHYAEEISDLFDALAERLAVSRATS
jgi:chromosome partitioning protein